MKRKRVEITDEDVDTERGNIACVFLKLISYSSIKERSIRTYTEHRRAQKETHTQQQIEVRGELISVIVQCNTHADVSSIDWPCLHFASSH